MSQFADRHAPRIPRRLVRLGFVSLQASFSLDFVPAGASGERDQPDTVIDMAQ
jgi:hypothetical protein